MAKVNILKDYIIAARLTLSEYDKLMMHCKAKGITVSQFVREAISRIPD
jgi:hypothetical protein